MTRFTKRFNHFFLQYIVEDSDYYSCLQAGGSRGLLAVIHCNKVFFSLNGRIGKDRRFNSGLR